MSTTRNLTLLRVDASNRAIRVFTVQIGIDVGLAVVMLLVTTFQAANTWDDIEWTLLGFSMTKTIVASVGAYCLRRFLDPSGIPTPLPPAESGEPNEVAA